MDEINRLKEAIADADAVVIGAGAGLSTAAGFTYTGERFEKYFSDFRAKYGFTDMYSGGFHDFVDPEEFWAYWSRYIYINRYMDIPKDTYEKLLKAVEGKEYFVITTNVDHCFQRAGFDKNRLFYTQGDYGLFQCSLPCHKKTYDNESMIKEMVARQADMKIPSELIPKCPVCGRPMTMNLRSDGTFVEDSGWHEAALRYEKFLEENKRGKILFLELGVGYNTPVIIKYPFMRMTMGSKDAVYACLSRSHAECIPEIKDRSILINRDIDEVLTEICGGR